MVDENINHPSIQIIDKIRVFDKWNYDNVIKEVKLDNQLKKILLILLIVILSQPLFCNTTADKTVAWLKAKGVAPELIVVIISMIPVVELRGSIPVAILLFNIPWLEAAVLSIIGNMIPVPFLLLLIDWFLGLISKVKPGRKFTEWLFTRTRRKGKSIEKYEEIGLVVFVGIPLPGTGGWTGALAANIFGLRFWRSMLFIFLGVIMAAIIVTALSLMGTLAL
ncbi:MAG TPA: small multi-drug export protein [Candidatus Cloacimonas acidaminovorans]|nr:small multi-drug export protein [Candidatus Cloacimonas acidaminovorans]